MREIKDSKIFLENLLNKKIEYIAYPYGNYNENTLKIVKELEFKAAYLADGPWAYKNDGVYLYRRVYISSLKDMNNFIERVTNPNYKR
jgi:peptidoglycan/xylan/chitin deacetylase (PgdA/CDA1 family)